MLVKPSGLVQVGIPETIKDMMPTPDGVPLVFVLTRELFDYERGVRVAEVDFPSSIITSSAVLAWSSSPVLTKAVYRLIQEAVPGPD